MSTDAGSLGFLEASGTPFDIGMTLGRFGAGIVHDYLVSTPAWQSVMAFRGDERLGAMQLLVKERLPDCWLELEGLTQGLGLPLDDVFAWNCRGDVWALSPDGCTTVMIPGSEPVIAHNEDGDPGLRGHCALASIRPEAGKAFVAFVYPGSIPGHTFAATQSGLVQAVNNIRSREAGIGLPRMLVGRAALNCRSLDQAVRLIETVPRAGAFHFSLAQRGDSRVVSVEFTHRNVSTAIVQHPSCHANHLVHSATAGERQVVTGSSGARQRRGETLLLAAGGEQVEPLSILWDEGDGALPIHREQPDDPDGENTLATALFRVGSDAVGWEVYDGVGNAPRFRLNDVTLLQ